MNLVKYVIKTSFKTIGDDIAKYIYLSKLCKSNRKQCEDALLVATNFCGVKEKNLHFGKDCDGCYVKWIDDGEYDFDVSEVKTHEYKCSKFSMNVPCDNKDCRYHKMNNLLHKYLKEYEETKKLKQYFINEINERIK